VNIPGPAANRSGGQCINTGMSHSTSRVAAALTVLPMSVVVPALLAAPSSAAANESAPKPAAGAPSATFAEGVLTVRGTREGERMSVVRNGRQVTVRVGGTKVPLPKGYKNSKCDEIRLLGLGGDDRMTVKSSKGSLPDVVLVGGKGDDELRGGLRSDVLNGGQGDDELRPGDGGQDVLVGGIGTDTYLLDADLPGRATIDEPAADGPDLLSFAATSRSVSVALGTSTPQVVSSAYTVVLPHLGIETVTGGDGDDTLRAGGAPSRMHGGPGNDLLSSPFDVPPSDGSVWSGDAGDDTFRLAVSCTGACHGSTLLEDSSGNDTVSFAGSGGSATLDLRLTTWQAVATAYDVQLAPGSTFENAVGAFSGGQLTGTDLANRLEGGNGSDTLTGNGGADTFVAVVSTFPSAEAADTITDFTGGTDTVDLVGLTVKGGLGTSTVTVWDGTHDHGTITASNGHLWEAGDFS
jgi:Ca2+-binding RTX toxin-like protein